MEPKESLDELQGVWYVHSLEVQGTPQPLDSFAGARFVVEGDAFRSEGMGSTYAGQIVADRSRLELHFTSGPERGNVNRGLYKFGRDGAWTLCLDTTGGAAPRSFSTAGKHGVVTKVLRRDPPTTVEQPAEPSGEAIEAMQSEWTMLSCVRDGEPLPAHMVEQGRRSVRGTAFVLQFGTRLFQSGRLYAVPGRPDAFDLALTDGGLCRGIFEVTGDRLTTCFGSPDAERPADFASRPGEGRTLAEWQRAVR